MLLQTILYSSGSLFGSGNSARMRTSIVSLTRSLSWLANMSSICAFGRPRFWNSMTWMQAIARPKMLFFLMSMSRASNLSLNTRATISGRSFGVWFESSDRVISDQFGLHVNVTNRSGLPCFCTTAIASW